MAQRGRHAGYYYFAFRLIHEARRRRETSLYKQRMRLRNSTDPCNISDKEFANRYRLNKEAFKFLCNELRCKSSLKSSQRITLEHKVLCALSFYATGSYQRIVGMGKNLGQTTVSKYIQEVTKALNHPTVANTFIKFPSSRADRDLIKQRFFRKYGIPGVIGCIDGSHFHIVKPNREVEHLFYCRKHFHALNVQVVCDSDCNILNVNPKYGGATHDAFIWENSKVNMYMQELHNSNEQVWLLGDSGYPQRPWLMTPILNAIDGSREANYTTLHGRARVVIENTFGRLKNRWRCLNKDRTLHYKPERCANIITACCVLHNYAQKFAIPDPEGYAPNLNVRETPEAPSTTHAAGGDDLREVVIRGRALRTLLINRIRF